jgi:PadR family transcriptional regulator PadR
MGGRVKGDRVSEFEELTLLAVRALGEDAYAVPIQQFIERNTRREVVMGAVYAALDRLERKGHVRSKVGGATPVRGGKAKRFYAPTARGSRMIHELRTQREAMWRGAEDTSQ